MSLQYKSLAIVVGAQGEEIGYVADALKNAAQANTATAEQLLMEYRNNK
jgi:hydroxymethylglutaryl-CoA reductase